MKRNAKKKNNNKIIITIIINNYNNNNITTKSTQIWLTVWGTLCTKTLLLEIFYVDEVKQMANEPESLKSMLLTLDRELTTSTRL